MSNSPFDIRQFETGATRDLDDDKLDYEGFLSPIVLRRFAEYMHEHRKTAAGLRDSDNWQKGIPLDVYMKSLTRHFIEMWLMHRGEEPLDYMDDTICAIMFNAMGYLHVWLKGSE